MWSVWSVWCALSIACTPLADPDERLDGGEAEDAGTDAFVPDAGIDTGPPCEPDPGAACPPRCMRPEREIGDRVDGLGHLVAVDLTLSCAFDWTLPDQTYVAPGATLTIEPGVWVDAGSRGALIVQRGARLEAAGTEALPITFDGPTRGAWAGVFMLGAAPLVGVTADRPDDYQGDERDIEAFADGRMGFGGDDATHDCGTLRFVRIRHAGRANRLVLPVNVHPLLLAGCGTQTEVDFVHVHRANHDGLGVYGGEVTLEHLVVTEVPVGQAYNLDFGWAGRGQYWIGHNTSDNDESGIEGRRRHVPLGHATVANVTLISGRRNDAEAIYMTSAAGIFAYNVLVEGFEEVVHVFDGTLRYPGWLEESLLLEGVLANVAGDFAREPEVERAYGPPAFGNRVGATGLDPALTRDVLEAPNFRPSAAAGTGAATLPEAFEPTDYLGAVDPDGEDWTAGWTLFE